MNKIRRFAQMQVLVLSLLSSTVVPIATRAADEVHGKFTLKSETHWGTNVLPAGDYTYTLATLGALPVVLIRSITGKEAAFVAPASEADTDVKTANELTITKIGGVNVITELHVNDEGLVLYYNTAANPAESAAKMKEPKLTAYAAK